MVRSISSLRPISGSMRPSWAWAFRLTAYFSSALPDSVSRSPSTPASSRSLSALDSPVRDRPWEMKFTTSSRVTWARASRNTAWLCFSLKIATSTLTTPTSFLPLDCTWNTARCSTR